MRLKDKSVNIENLDKRIADRLPDVDAITRQLCGCELVVTSGNDGRHKTGSLHYKDRAVDIRTWYIPKTKRQQYLWSLQYIFHERFFDIVDEGDHYHIELDEKE